MRPDFHQFVANLLRDQILIPPLGTYEVDQCPATIPGDETINDPHTPKDRAIHNLQRIPELAALLNQFLEPGTTPPDPNARRASGANGRVPSRLDVIDLMHERHKQTLDQFDPELDRYAGQRRQGILPTLSLWVMLTDCDMHDTGLRPEPAPQPATIATECAWLLQHVDWILDMYGHQFVADLDWMRTDLERIHTRPDFQPECPKCKSHVEGQYPPDEERVKGRGPAWWRCPGCGQTWRHDAEVKRLFSLQGMTLTECAQQLGKPVSTLRNLKAEGRFMPVGRRGTVALYDLEIVTRALAKSRPVGRPRKSVS